MLATSLFGCRSFVRDVGSSRVHVDRTRRVSGIPSDPPLVKTAAWLFAARLSDVYSFSTLRRVSVRGEHISYGAYTMMARTVLLVGETCMSYGIVAVCRGVLWNSAPLRHSIDITTVQGCALIRSRAP